MKHIFNCIDNQTTNYFIIKEKAGHKYRNIKRYKNNIFNRLLLSTKKFDSNKQLYIIPEFKGVEGMYYKIN